VGILFGYISLSFLLSSPEREQKKDLSLSPFFFCFVFFGSRSCRFWSLDQSTHKKRRTPPGRPSEEGLGFWDFYGGIFMFALSQIGERADSLVGEINQNILHFAFETRRVVSTNKKKVNNRSRSRGTFCLDFLLLLLLPRSLSLVLSLSLRFGEPPP